eukprot:184166-Heterocapsa_arctica.AAC.1
MLFIKSRRRVAVEDLKLLPDAPQPRLANAVRNEAAGAAIWKLLTEEWCNGATVKHVEQKEDAGQGQVWAMALWMQKETGLKVRVVTRAGEEWVVVANSYVEARGKRARPA